MDYSKMSLDELNSLYDDFTKDLYEAEDEGDEKAIEEIGRELDLIEEEIDKREQFSED